jgi:hypothetical protein
MPKAAESSTGSRRSWWTGCWSPMRSPPSHRALARSSSSRSTTD